MIKTKTLMSVCLATVLMASLFLISGVNGEVTIPTLPPLNNDSRTSSAPIGNSTITSPDSIIVLPEGPDRFAYSDETWGQFYSTTGKAVGVYAAQITYLDESGTNQRPFFVPSLVVKCDSNLGNYWGIFDMQITATARFPNGTAVQSFQYSNLKHMISPDNKVSEWEKGITKAIGIIKHYYPAISMVNDLTIGSSTGGGLLEGWSVTDSVSGSSATSTFHQDWYYAIPPSERGHQFRFDLDCDPQVPGDYIIDVNYDITLGGAGYSHVSFTQRVYYEYRPAPKAYVSNIETYSYYGSAAGINNPGYLIGDVNDQFAHLHAGDYGDQAVIVGRLNTQKTGRVYLYGYSTRDYFSHLLVYVSYDGNNWGNPILNAYVWTPDEDAFYIDCGFASNINYIAIAAYDDLGWSSALNIDAVCIYNY